MISHTFGMVRVCNDMSWLGPGFGQMLFGNDFMGNAPKADLPALPAAPDPNAAVQTALDAQNLERRKLLATGGNTDVTGGKAMILGSDINTLNMGGM